MSEARPFDEPRGNDRGMPEKRSRSPCLVLLAWIGGAALLLGLSCCGYGIWFFRGMGKEAPLAEAAVTAFFDELRAGKHREAYLQTASAFQASASQDRFLELLAQYPVLTRATSREIQMQRFYGGTEGKRIILLVNLKTAEGATPCTMTLAKEAGEWKILGINMP